MCRRNQRHVTDGKRGGIHHPRCGVTSTSCIQAYGPAFRLGSLTAPGGGRPLRIPFAEWLITTGSLYGKGMS
jgi:hypothetical protein